MNMLNHALFEFLDASINSSVSWEDQKVFDDFLKFLQSTIGGTELEKKVDLIYPIFVVKGADDIKIREGEYALVKEPYKPALRHFRSLVECLDDRSRVFIHGKTNRLPKMVVINQSGTDGKCMELAVEFDEKTVERRGVTFHMAERNGPTRRSYLEKFKFIETENVEEEIEGRDPMERLTYCHYPLMQNRKQHLFYFLPNQILGSAVGLRNNIHVELLVSSSQNLGKKNRDFFQTAVSLLYHQTRIVPIIKTEKLKTAIISILVDSYAHNIAAHSLVAIENWFRRRGGFLNRSSRQLSQKENLAIQQYEIDYGYLKNILDLKTKLNYRLGIEAPKTLTLGDLVTLALNDDEGYSVLERALVASFLPDGGFTDGEKSRNMKIPMPVDYLIWPFIRFLRGKSAFWSGVTRDLPFGGQHISIHKIIFNEFASNALYVGTISATEGVHKLNIRIGLDHHFGLHSEEEIRFYDYIQINTEVMRRGSVKSSKSTPSEDDEQQADFLPPFDLDDSIQYSRFGFVRLGKDFSKLRKRLDQEIAFMPGRIVGLHSFMTILENTIRNVKHYRHCLPQMQKEGLNLLISFEKMDLFKVRLNEEIAFHDQTYKGKSRIYRVGISIGHPIKSANDPFKEIIQKLSNKILDLNTGQATLGGTSQDKICSSMLLTNKFINVESVQGRLDYFYYPWTHPIRLSPQDFKEMNTFDKELSDALRSDVFKRKRFRLEDKNGRMKKVPPRSEGKYFFKFFNVWQSGEVTVHKTPGRELQNTSESRLSRIFRQSDNPSRFKLLIVDDILHYIELLEARSEERNIFRVLQADTDVALPDIQSAMKSWNECVFPGEYAVGIYQCNSQSLKWSVGYTTSGGTIRDIDDRSPGCEMVELAFMHGLTAKIPEGFNVLNYRSHGILLERFADVRDTPCKGIKREKILEFTETVSMAVKIWDERIYQRVRGHTEDMNRFSKSLLLEFYNEEASSSLGFSGPEIEAGKPRKNGAMTIYAVHLSYIHELHKSFSEPGNDKKIDWFIETYLSDSLIRNTEGNIFKVDTFYSFCLCVISGRGNAEWYTSEISAKYVPYVIYKPIESLLNAVSDALEIADDFQLKYNICKTLIG